jgi:hypothetical protein
MSNDVQKALDDFFAYVDNDVPFPGPAPKVGPHGKVVDVRFEPYHDVTVYEDGYEERFYIGE